jgi:hypothetical protein
MIIAFIVASLFMAVEDGAVPENTAGRSVVTASE